MKRTSILIISGLIAAVILIVAYTAPDRTKEEDALIATSFVKDEATYRFDGIPETLRLTKTAALGCSGCWEFEFAYQSRNSGYGDRSGAVVAPVITDHSARVVVEKGIVTLAVLDGTWDMMVQKPYAPPSQTYQPVRRR